MPEPMEQQTEKELLDEWKIEAVTPPGFNSVVWRRIEQQRPSGFREWIDSWLGGLITRPAVALSYASAAIILGLVAGNLSASKNLQRRENELQFRYVQSIDPYAAGVGLSR